MVRSVILDIHIFLFFSIKFKFWTPIPGIPSGEIFHIMEDNRGERFFAIEKYARVQAKNDLKGS
jgi:hypothetical protein